MKIGNDIIIGAGSVITKDIPNDSVYAGNPAKWLCSLSDYKDRNLNSMNDLPSFNRSYATLVITEELKQDMKNKLSNSHGYFECQK